MQNSKNIVVLIVEDDPVDQKSIEQAFNNQEVIDKVHIVASAEEALEYLQRSKEQDSNAPRPNLILLDLILPGMQGKEFLKCIKEDEQLCSIPVVVLTSSNNDADIEQSYKLYAAGYAQKPLNAAELDNIVKKLVKYWFTTSSLL
jgi:CheY-like chemotaxis protein